MKAFLAHLLVNLLILWFSSIPNVCGVVFLFGLFFEKGNSRRHLTTETSFFINFFKTSKIQGFLLSLLL